MATSPSTPTTMARIEVYTAGTAPATSTTATEVTSPSQAKIIHLIDHNLMSGSGHTFRAEVGGYFTIASGEDPTFVNFNPMDTQSKWIYSAISFSSEDDIEIPGGSTTDTIVPSHKYVVAVDGDPTVVDGDKFWRALWTGGAVNGVSYGSFWTPGTYDDYYTRLGLPYPALEKQILINPEEVENYIQISPEYNVYLPDYQRYASQLPERLLPNIYLINWTKNYAESSDDLLANVYEYLSLGEVAVEPWTNFDSTDNLHEYLDEMIPRYVPSSDSQTYMDAAQQNIFFNHNATEKYYEETLLSASTFPYACKISLETTPISHWGTNIQENEFGSRFLRMLKEIFLEQTPTEIAPSIISFMKHSSYLSASTDNLRNETIKEIEDVQYKSVDMFDLLLYSYGSIKNKYTDFMIIDEKNNETMSTYDTKGVYRYINTAATLSVMDKGLKYLNEEGGFQPLDVASLLNAQTIPLLHETYKKAPQIKHNETLAYRIEKKAASNTPGFNTGVPIQNFWFFNSDQLNNLDFLDTQIKYDKDYTYNVYAYILIEGTKYQFSDLQLSRIIGQPHQPTSTATYSTAMTAISPAVSIAQIGEQYCIEYYDPATDETVNDLLEHTAYTSGSLLISTRATEAQRIAKTRISALAGEASMPPYFANFVTTIEPSIRIIELPVFSKTLKVLDNPPNRLNILSNYIVDNSQTLSFEAHYEAFFAMPYPNAVSVSDVERQEAYLHAYDWLPSTEVTLPTVSLQNAVQVYRIDKKPTSFRDFENALIRTHNLNIPGLDGAYTSKQFYDRVEANKKYYYLFRVTNELGAPGYVDEIIEAELISDGGYKYAVFDSFFKADLEVKHFNDISRPVKKLMQVTPAIQQSMLIDTSADYSETAASQLENIEVGTAAELIWGRTFKLRLTSKKTGKKIDLNLTYNLNRDLSSE